MRDDDRMMDLPEEFGSGIVGVCDICGVRQAVIILRQERYKLCVLDFLNKTWLKSDKKPGAPAPLYRSERVWFPTDAATTGKAPAILLTPTKVVRHPVLLITPDVYGITTTLLDAAIRFARDGYEVMIPDVAKTDGIGAAHHVALRTGARIRGGIPMRSGRVVDLLHLYTDALAYLRGREMVDPAKSALFGASYGASLALMLASQDTKLTAVALAYPQPVAPPDLAKLVTAPIVFVGGSRDGVAKKSWEQIRSSGRPASARAEHIELAGVRHDFLARDLSAYAVGPAESAWTQVQSFLKQLLLPPPPKPPAPPGLKAAPPSPPPAGAPPPKAAAGPAPRTGPAPSRPSSPTA